MSTYSSIHLDQFQQTQWITRVIFYKKRWKKVALIKEKNLQ